MTAIGSLRSNAAPRFPRAAGAIRRARLSVHAWPWRSLGADLLGDQFGKVVLVEVVGCFVDDRRGERRRQFVEHVLGERPQVRIGKEQRRAKRPAEYLGEAVRQFERDQRIRPRSSSDCSGAMASGPERRKVSASIAASVPVTSSTRSRGAHACSWRSNAVSCCTGCAAGCASSENSADPAAGASTRNRVGQSIRATRTARRRTPSAVPASRWPARAAACRRRARPVVRARAVRSRWRRGRFPPTAPN